MSWQHDKDRTPARRDMATLRAVPMPAGTEVLSGPRCGDKDRDRANDRVGDAYARGYLTENEAEARRDAIGRATMLAELGQLVADLPDVARWSGASLPDRKIRRPFVFDKWWQSHQPLTGIGAMIAGALFAAIPGLTLAALTRNGGLIAAVAVPTVVVGAIVLFSGLGSIMSRYG